jgi:hypothetical protein
VANWIASTNIIIFSLISIGNYYTIELVTKASII